MVGRVFDVEVYRARTTHEGVRAGDGVDGGADLFDGYVGGIAVQG